MKRIINYIVISIFKKKNPDKKVIESNPYEEEEGKNEKNNYVEWLQSLSELEVVDIILRNQSILKNQYSKFTHRGFGESGAIELSAIFLVGEYLKEKIDNTKRVQIFLSDILYGLEGYMNEELSIVMLSDYWDEVIRRQYPILSMENWHDTYRYLNNNFQEWISFQGISKSCYAMEDYNVIKGLYSETWEYEEIEIRYDTLITPQHWKNIYPTYHFYPGTPCCPKCNQTMFKSIFPIQKEYPINYQGRYYFIKRIFTCYGCKTFYAPIPGSRLSDGRVFKYVIKDTFYEHFLNKLDTLTTTIGRNDI